MAVFDGIRRRSLHLLRRVPTPLFERAVRLGSPSYTLGAACLIEHDGKVLLVQTAYRRTWSLPGGLLDRREPPLDGLRREVREEVGRVSWPTQREVQATTIVVIIFSLIMGLYLFAIDAAFNKLVELIFRRLGGAA